MTLLSFSPDLHVEVFPDRRALCYADPNTRTFDVAEIGTKGMSTPNGCGSVSSTQVPGRLTVFARPAHWWERAAQ